MIHKPTKDRVLVTDEREQLSDTIVIPEASKERAWAATVIRVGPKNKDVKPGDKVIVGKFGGNELDEDGKKLRLLYADDILAVFEQPTEQVA